jgi:hypothetical protein
MTMWVRKRWALGALVIAVLALLGACGVPAEEDPHAVVLPPPYGETATSPAPAPTTDDGPLTKVLYLIRDGRLVPVVRPVETMPPLMDLLEDLAAGPVDAERQQGFTSALAAGTPIVDDVELVGGLATVALTETGLEGLTGPTQQLAIAQIVCTLDAREDVTGVVFARAGQQFPVPRGDGAQTDAQLTIADYESLLEPR